VGNQSSKQDGATDTENFFGAFVLDQVAEENACHHDELQEPIDSVEPKSVIRLFNFLALELEQVDPTHDKRNTHKGACHRGPVFPDEDYDTDKDESTHDAPNA
jgi:hypothetical protein